MKIDQILVAGCADYMLDSELKKKLLVGHLFNYNRFKHTSLDINF